MTSFICVSFRAPVIFLIPVIKITIESWLVQNKGGGELDQSRSISDFDFHEIDFYWLVKTRPYFSEEEIRISTMSYVPTSCHI